MKYLIKNFDQYVTDINSVRAGKGEKPHKKKDWAAFLSNYMPVKKTWVDKMTSGEGMSKQDNVLFLLAALNAARKRHGLDVLDAGDVIEELRGAA